VVLQAFSEMISTGNVGVIGVFGALVICLLVVFIMLALAYKRARSGGGKKVAVDKTKASDKTSNASDYVPYLNDAIASMKSEIVQMDAKLVASQGGAPVASPDQSAQLIALQSQLTAKETELNTLRAELAAAKAAAAQAAQAAAAAPAAAAPAPTPAPAAGADPAKITELEAQVAAVTAEKTALEGQLKDAQAQVTALTQERDDLKAALLAKDKEIEEAKAAVPEGGGGDDSELKEKISFLESQLAEYEVIEEDIANLKKLQEEKEALENKVKELEAGGGGAPAAAAPAKEEEAAPAKEAAAGGDEFAAEEGVDDGSAIANEFEEFLDEGNPSS
jgi:chromosome segregation ATPase